MQKKLKTRKSIEKWLKDYGITYYVIHDDLVVDVKSSIDLSDKKITHLPIQFGVVEGSFDIMKNLLTTLEGMPLVVKGQCNVMNNKLTSLKGSPTKILGSFFVSLNKLTSLAEGPQWVRENFVCVNNPIETLRGFNTLFGGRFIHGASTQLSYIKPIDGLGEHYGKDKSFHLFCEIDKYSFGKILTIIQEKEQLENIIVDTKDASYKLKI